MERGKWMYVIDWGLILSSLGVIVTGLIKFRTLHHLLGLNINYDTLPNTLLRTIHDWSGFAMFVFVVIHLILHWGWFVEMTKTYLGGNSNEDLKAPKPSRAKKSK